MILLLFFSLILSHIAFAMFFNYRKAFFCSIVVWNFYLFLMTEFFSLFHGINRLTVILTWVIYCCASLVVILKNKVKLFDLVGEVLGRVKKLSRSKCRGDETNDADENNLIGNFLLLGCAVIAIIMFFVAIITPPNNWDSLTYHLSRVMNWMQNGSVDYYTTNIRRSLFSPPFAEYIVLHIYELAGNDRFVNLVQWVSYVNCGIGVYFVADKIKLNPLYRDFCVFISCTLPMAIAQSCTTQVDLIGSMWLIVFFWFLLDLVDVKSLDIKECEQLISVVMCALSVGLGYVTKSTVCFVMVPFLVYLLVIRICAKDKFVKLLPFAGIAAVFVLVLAAPTFIRNYRYTGDIMAADYMGGIMVGSLSPIMLFLNMYKNVGMLGARPSTYSSIGSFGEKIAKIFGKNIDDELISLTGDYRNRLSISFDKEFAPNSVVLYTFIIACVIVLGMVIASIIKKKKGKECDDKQYLGLMVAAIFSAILLCMAVRYQVWGNRLLLPALYSMCFVIAYALDKSQIREIVKYSWLMLIVLFAFMDAYNCIDEQFDPIRDLQRYGNNRESVFFRLRENEEEYSELEAVVKANGYNTIGLMIQEDTFEYPLWVQLKNDDTRIVHIVENNQLANRVSETVTEKPDCIIAIDQERQYIAGDKSEIEGERYTCIWNYEGEGQYAVLEKR